MIGALLITLALDHAASLGSLPDASQEALLQQFDGSQSSLALFHYVVPPDSSRASWEFAAFQDHPGCPRRMAYIHIQHGSIPIVNTSQYAPDFFYAKRTGLATLVTRSDYQPADYEVHSVYNPLPGSWFAVAYLEPYTEGPSLFSQRCRYSVGSIALWMRLDGAAPEILLPNARQKFVTRRNFSYYRFHVSDGVGAFRLSLTNCKQRVGTSSRRQLEHCIDYADVRPRALPFRDPYSPTARHNITQEGAHFDEDRVAARGADYYLLVVTREEVSFDADLRLAGCGEAGLYGKRQHKWFLTEKGLMWAEEVNSTAPREPADGFQLLSVVNSKILNSTQGEEINYEFRVGNEIQERPILPESLPKLTCRSTFDFSRIDSVSEFTVNYLLQGKSWYTKWLTVLEHEQVITRFDTHEYLDIGGFVNLRVHLDEKTVPSDQVFQVIRGCLSHDRPPPIHMDQCPEEAAFRVSNRNASTMEVLRVIPYPEPGRWHMSFQASCGNRTTGEDLASCPSNIHSPMVSVMLHTQPCGYRPTNAVCGESGVCAKVSRGPFRFSACRCFGGRRGMTCDDTSAATSSWQTTADMLLLTLSNLAFVPAVVLAAYFGLFAESLVYAATAASSSLYHVCDRGTLTSGMLPASLQAVCFELYVEREVLQFCDFYCATLSFWVTVIALAHLAPPAAAALNAFGVLLIAALIQHNRTGASALLAPLCLAAVLLSGALIARTLRRRKALRPNRMCLALVTPAAACAGGALALVGLAETKRNYPYVHSVWHALMAASLLLLVPRCRRRRSKNTKEATGEDNSGTSISTDEEELATVSSADNQMDGSSHSNTDTVCTNFSIRVRTLC